MPFDEFRELDLSRLEDAPIINTLPVEACEDIDGDGHCYCIAPQPDPQRPSAIGTEAACGVPGCECGREPLYVAALFPTVATRRCQHNESSREGWMTHPLGLATTLRRRRR